MQRWPQTRLCDYWLQTTSILMLGLACVGCSGNDESTALRELLSEIDLNQTDYGNQDVDLEGKERTELLISLNSQEAAIIESYLDSDGLDADARTALERWQGSLDEVILIHRRLIEDGRGPDQATPDEVKELTQALREIEQSRIKVQSMLNDPPEGH